MFMKILLGIGVAMAILSLVNRISGNRVENLRKAGIYPLAGQETEADVDRLIRMKRKIEAIKVYRTLHGVGLKEAKEAVEARQAELASPSAGASAGMGR